MVGGSALFGARFVDAVPAWRDAGLLNLAGYDDHTSDTLAAYLGAALTAPGAPVPPDLDGYLGYLEGLRAARALRAGVQAARPRGLALFQVAPSVSLMGAMGHGQHGGGLLYDAGNVIRYNDFVTLGRASTR